MSRRTTRLTCLLLSPQGCYLEIEHLKSQIHQTRLSKRTDEPQTKARSTLFPLADPSSKVSRSALTSRIFDDKVLRSLHVEVDSVTNPRGSGSRGRNRAATDSALLRRSFLKENVVCRLSLDQSALDSSTSTSSKKSRTSDQEEVAKRVGRLCSDIVASCCYVLDVKDVAKLPRYLETLQRLAQIAPVYQAFTEKLEQKIRHFNSVSVSAARLGVRLRPYMLTRRWRVAERVRFDTRSISITGPHAQRGQAVT